MKKWLPVIVAAAIAVGSAQTQSFTLDQILSYPFPDNLVAAPTGSTIAWTLNERGVRNIYVAEGPEFTARKVTAYADDDGQELTNLSFSPDAKTIVYVRGGDHGANWSAEGNLQPNPTSNAEQPRMQVCAASIAGGGSPRLLGEGDEPVVSPRGDRVAFVHDRRIWISPLDGSKPAEQAFFARGTSGSPVWSPDGSKLAFVSDRDDHSFVGIFSDATQPIRYIEATTSRDSTPLWSPDSRALAFVRQPGRGGTPGSPLTQQPQPWSIFVGSTTNGPQAPTHAAWSSGAALVDSIPRTAGGVNLHWAADDRLVFLSYQDNWPHLYSIQHPDKGGAAKLLTPGAFMVEHVAISPDRRFIVYSANTGADRTDIDRRHIFKVPVDGSTPPIALTSGSGLEWSPVVTGDGQHVAFLGSDAHRPPLPAIVPLAGGPPKILAAAQFPTGFPSARLVTPEPITFKSSDGVEVHAQLFKAPGDRARRPALVYVHGGPPRQMLLGWHYMNYYANDYAVNQYLTSRGFIVLSVNYRLGIGYGHGFQYAERAGARGASEYLDVLAAGKYLQSRGDVDARRIGIWGGSYGGYLTALALGRNSDVFAAGVDIHGLHDRIPTLNAEQLARAIAGDGISEADYKQVLKVAYESSPISAVATWKSPVLLIHGDDDRNVQFHQTVDLKRRLLEKGVSVEEVVIADDIHDFLLWRSWQTVTNAAGQFLEKQLLRKPPSSQP